MLEAETGEGAFCPLPVCPSPVAIPPTVRCNGESQKKELARGKTSECMGGVGEEV